MIKSLHKEKIARDTSGFTLLELLAVLAIMIIIMGISVTSFYGFGRGARVRTAVNSLRGRIALGRQFAILHSTDVEIRFGSPANGQHYCYVYDAGNNYAVGETNFLPVGVEFDDLSDLEGGYSIPFNSTGSGDAQSYTLSIMEPGAGVDSIEVTVFGITGLVQVE